MFVLLSGQFAFSETVKLYKDSESQTLENPFEESVDNKAFYTSDSIFFSGKIDQSTINSLNECLHYSSSSQIAVQVIDLSEAYFDSSEALDWTSLCSGLRHLSCFRFPNEGIKGKCRLDKIFYNCEKLEHVENLDKIEQICSLSQAFCENNSLEELSFSEDIKKLDTVDESSSLKQPLYEAFGYCKSLKHVKNFDKFENIHSLERVFYDCKSLEEITFTEQRDTLVDSGKGMQYAFYNCSSLKSIDNLDKFVVNSNIAYAFYGCISLTEIRLGTVNTAYGWKTFYNCNAIIYIDVETSYINTYWEDEVKGQIIWPIEAITALVGFTNDKSYLDISYSPAYAIMQDTIFRIGDSFETSVQVELNEITEKNSKKYLWIGIKNESMKDYTYTDSIKLIIKTEEAFAVINSNKVSVDTMDAAIKNYSGDTIRFIGLFDEYRMDRALKVLKKNKYKIVDFSDAQFSLDTLNISHLFEGSSKLIKFSFPKEKQTCSVSMESAFVDCKNLEEVANFDKIVSIKSIKQAFYGCLNLEEIIFSQESDTIAIDLSETFYNCKKLKRVENIDRFNKITSISYTFLNCSSLEELHLPTVIENETVYVRAAFNGCSSLKKLIGFDAIRKFDDNEMDNTFYNCSSLDTIRISVDISNFNLKSAFTGCNALKYLPEDVKELNKSDKLESLKNFVLPIKRVYFQLDTLSILQYPQYCAVQDTLWRCVLHTKDTMFVKELTDDIIKKSDMISCGLKNESMEDYCWSYSVYSKELDVPYLVVEDYYKGEKDYGYGTIDVTNMTMPVVVTLDEVGIDNLENAYNLQLHGEFNDSTLSLVKKSLSKNTALHSCDMSDAKLDITHALTFFFSDKKFLSEVKFPSGENDNPISLSGTFYNTEDLRKVDLTHFTNITDMDSVFLLSGVDTILLPKKLNENKVSFRYSFEGCSVDSLDLSNFPHISNLLRAFSFAGLRYLKFSDAENTLPVSMTETFAGAHFCMPEIINFNKFTNVTSFAATFEMAGGLRDCGKLDTLRFGSDPNTLDADNLTWTFLYADGNIVKYLPDSVDTLPAKWRGYQNFVLPLDVDYTNWTAHSLLEDIFSLPDIIPSYAFKADTTRYLVLMDFLKIWLSAVGFTVSELRSADSEVEYIIFDPETMNLEDYKEYALTCVVSNPKYKALAYALSVNDILNSTITSISDDAAQTNIRITGTKDGISIASEENIEIEVVNSFGVTCFRGNANNKELSISLPVGIYMVLNKGELLKKVIVK